MNLDDAKSNFKKILSTLEVSKLDQLLNWIKDEYVDKLEFRSDGISRDGNEKMKDQTKYFESDDKESKEVKSLNKIADYLKKIHPFGTKLSKEKIPRKVNGWNASLDLDTAVEIDAFIYNQNDKRVLEKAGLVSGFYCTNCKDSIGIKLVKVKTNSRKKPKKSEAFCTNCNSSNWTKSIKIMISHSIPRNMLHELFRYSLDSDLLKGKQILDIGSRFGSFLYAAYVYTVDSKIIGIEMNKEACDIAEKVIGKFKYDDRIQIVNDDVLNCSEIVQSSDIIFMNNVFEFFLPDDVQLTIWKFLKKNFKKGAILVTIPSVDKMTKNLTQDFSAGWLCDLNANDKEKEGFQRVVHRYQVI